jgi:hypothetical protein
MNTTHDSGAFPGPERVVATNLRDALGHFRGNIVAKDNLPIPFCLQDELEGWAQDHGFIHGDQVIGDVTVPVRCLEELLFDMALSVRERSAVVKAAFQRMSVSCRSTRNAPGQKTIIEMPVLSLPSLPAWCHQAISNHVEASEYTWESDNVFKDPCGHADALHQLEQLLRDLARVVRSRLLLTCLDTNYEVAHTSC